MRGGRFLFSFKIFQSKDEIRDTDSKFSGGNCSKVLDRKFSGTIEQFMLTW